MKRSIYIFILLLFFGNLYAKKKADGIYFKILTNKGVMEGELFYKQRPLSVCSFVGLAEGTLENKTFPMGKHFFDGLLFYRINKDKFVQTGSPYNLANGSNGAGYYFHDEIDSTILHDRAGLLGYSNQGPNTNSSEFYITKKPMPVLDYRYTIFGGLTSGFDVLYNLAQDDTIIKVIIIRVGKEANAFVATKESFEQYQYAEFQKGETLKRNIVAVMNDYVNKYYPGADSLSSGVRIYHEVRGTGKFPSQKSMAQIRYFGFFQDSTIFDQSDTSGIPAISSIGVGKLTRGLEQGLKQMREGGVAYIFIPYPMAYGDTGYKDKIPPRTNLMYRIELLGVKNEE